MPSKLDMGRGKCVVGRNLLVGTVNSEILRIGQKGGRSGNSVLHSSRGSGGMRAGRGMQMRPWPRLPGTLGAKRASITCRPTLVSQGFPEDDVAVRIEQKSGYRARVRGRVSVDDRDINVCAQVSVAGACV